MTKNSIIQNISAVFLLLIFAISATPKKFLHDAFANHKDAKASTFTDTFHHKKISTATTHCSVDELVVEAPFVYADNHIEISLPEIFVIQQGELYKSYRSSLQNSVGLRGPPSIV